MSDIIYSTLTAPSVMVMNHSAFILLLLIIYDKYFFLFLCVCEEIVWITGDWGDSTSGLHG